jgi:hypothetical protein
MKRACHWKSLALSGVLALTLGASSRDGRAAGPAPGEGETIPNDPRLGATRGPLQAAVDRAGAAGLPRHPLVVKVREGLAKGIPPERIAVAVDTLVRGLDEANQFVRSRGRIPSSSLLEALADLHTRGVAWDNASPIVTARADDIALARAVETLAEMSQRGYPQRSSGLLLHDLEEHDPTAIGRVVAGLESIRRGLTVSRADALDALGSNLALDGATLDAAVTKSLEGKEHGAAAGNGHGNGQGSDHAAAASKKGLAKGLSK